jgi:hypothetical protein
MVIADSPTDSIQGGATSCVRDEVLGVGRPVPVLEARPESYASVVQLRSWSTVGQQHDDRLPGPDPRVWGGQQLIEVPVRFQQP